MIFNPKDKHMENLLERLEKDRAAVINFDSAKQISRYKQIRDMRKRDEIFIGMDRRKKKSIIFTTRAIKRKGNGFIL